jgi:CheY-like chemotaxis protein
MTNKNIDRMRDFRDACTPADKPTALLVDDDSDFLDLARLALEKLGFEVVTADGMRGAIDLLERCEPDLAVVDMIMEYPDAGLSVAKRIKARSPKIPVVLVSAVTSRTGLTFDATSPSEKSWLPVDAMLAKPLRMEQLGREVARLCG